jgi:hypothetical protein
MKTLKHVGYNVYAVANIPEHRVATSAFSLTIIRTLAQEESYIVPGTDIQIADKQNLLNLRDFLNEILDEPKSSIQKLNPTPQSN